MAGKKKPGPSRKAPKSKESKPIMAQAGGNWGKRDPNGTGGPSGVSYGRTTRRGR